jgi:hypothetical protein
MRRLLPALLLALSAAGCDPEVSSVGHDLGQLFPRRTHWFWKYDNNDFAEVSYWRNLGTTSPAGADWTTFQVWVALEQDEFLPDLADGDPSDWDVTFYFAERSSAWWLMGWTGNPDGPGAALGTETFDGDGVPFALRDVVTGRRWTSEAGGRTWTTTVTSLADDLEFHDQIMTDVWQIDLLSDTGDTPADGSWWLASGPGLVQWDLAPFRAEGDAPSPWQHLHNDSWDDVLGAGRR